MNWTSWREFFAMGGYALYVWGSFGVVALGMALEVWALARRHAGLRRAAPPSAVNAIPPEVVYES